MKIAMLGQKRIPSREGGVEIVVEELSTRMVKKGHEVTCYNRGGKHALDKNIKTSTEKEYKGVKLSKCFTIDKKGLAAMTSSFFGTIKAIFSKNEVVHYHAEGPCAWMWLVKWFTNKKIVATIHGLDWQRAKWGGFATKYIKFGEKCAAKYADEIIVLSENVKQYFKDTYNRETNFIPNGVNKPEIRKADQITKKYNLNKDEYILFLGRIVPEKGIHYLIDAYNDAKVDKKLVVAGAASDTDTYYTELKEKAKDNENIIFTGFVQGQMLEELYSNAYIYCLPSDLEGMPLSLLEGMSYSNCCLTSDIKECSEVLQDKGVTFNKSNVKDLTKKLKELCSNNKEVKKYKESAQKYIIDRYNWDDVTEKTLELYTDTEENIKKKKHEKNKKIINIITLLFFYICVFHNSLQMIIPFARYIDELLAAISIGYFIKKTIFEKKDVFTKNDMRIIVLLGGLVMIGLLSNCIYQYQVPYAAVLDCIAVTKFFLIYLFFKHININNYIEENKEIFKYNISVFIKYALILTGLNYLFAMFPAEIKFGILSNKLIFEHPTYLAAATSFVLLFYLYIEEKPDLKKIACLLFLIVTTLRSKAIIFAVLFSALYYIKIIRKKSLNLKMIIYGVIIALIIAIPSINYYFIKIDDSARSRLLQTSFLIANDHFPLGSGFATFGSQYSGIEYSPLYVIYDIDETYGLEKNRTYFISDSFWAMILGQFGYIGLLTYILALVLLITDTVKKVKPDERLKVIVYGTILYLLISSTSESAFVNALSFPFAILLATYNIKQNTSNIN